MTLVRLRLVARMTSCHVSAVTAQIVVRCSQVQGLNVYPVTAILTSGVSARSVKTVIAKISSYRAPSSITRRGSDSPVRTASSPAASATRTVFMVAYHETALSATRTPSNQPRVVRVITPRTAPPRSVGVSSVTPLRRSRWRGRNLRVAHVAREV